MSQILGALSGGDTVAMIREDYPAITQDDIAAAMSFASSLARFEDAPYETAFA